MALSAAIKPGGRLVIQDYYNVRGARLLPPSALLEKIFDAVYAAWKDTGANPDIGEELPLLLENAGFRVVELNPLIRIGRSQSQIWWWIDSFWGVQIERLVQGNYLSQEIAEKFSAEWKSRTSEPNNFYSQAIMLEIIAERV